MCMQDFREKINYKKLIKMFKGNQEKITENNKKD